MEDMVEHVATLEGLASECERCTEIGVRAPDVTSSTMSLLRGTKKSLVSYDVVSCDIRGPQRLAKELGKAFMFIQGDSLEVEIDPTELLMVDGKHTYGQVLAELERHYRSVERYIVLHDTHLYGNYGEDGSVPGLQTAFIEFLVNHPDWYLVSHTPVCCGLTVLGKL